MWKVKTDSSLQPLHVRPEFLRTAEQAKIGPFVLQPATSVTPVIQIPAAISRFLRPYQVEGVQFIWERYKEGRGGILGVCRPFGLLHRFGLPDQRLTGCIAESFLSGRYGVCHLRMLLHAVLFLQKKKLTRTHGGDLSGRSLGKTVQIIAFLSAIMHKTGHRTDENRRYKRIREMQTQGLIFKGLDPRNPKPSSHGVSGYPFESLSV